MMKISKPIVFFGTEDFSAKSLTALIESGFPVELIITKPDTIRGRGRHLVKPLVKNIGEKHSIKLLQPENIQEITPHIQKLNHPLGVLVSFGKIIPSTIIDLFSPGIINVHPSLLPKYRGPAPIESTILNGDEQTGVSIMQLSKDMDAGAVYLAKEYLLDGSETQEFLYDKLGDIGSQLLIKSIPDIANNVLQPIPQDHANASYCQLIQKSDGIIDWNKPAIHIEREVRAYHAWPKAQTILGEIPLFITSCRVAKILEPIHPGKMKHEKNRLFVATSQDWLEILTVQPLGKKEMPVRAFLAGYRERLTT